MTSPVTAEEIGRLRALVASPLVVEGGLHVPGGEVHRHTKDRDCKLCRMALALPGVLDALEAERVEVALLRAEMERARSLSRVKDEPRVGDSYTNGAIVKQIASYSVSDDHFQWHDGKRIGKSMLMSDPMWRKL